MYTTVIKVMLTTVMLLFVLMGAHAVVSLGFGWHGVILPVIMAIGVLWEIWYQPIRDEAYRQQILQEIEGFDMFEMKNPQNILDAKLLIADLATQLTVARDAYIELKENQPGEDDDGSRT